MPRLILLLRLLTGWSLFVVLCGGVLALGGNRPIGWILMSTLILVLFCLTLLLDMLQKRPIAVNRLWLPALLYLGVLLWGGAQLMVHFVPDSWAHPLWSLVPGAAASISADPHQGAHVLMRLAAYGMVFWIAVRTAQAPQTAHACLRAFAVFSMALAAYGLYAINTGSNVFLGDLASQHLSASFVNRNSYATFAGFGLVVCLGLLLRAAGSWERKRRRALLGLLDGLLSGGWLWITGILLCGGALMLTQSRGGAGAALIGVLTVLTTIRARGGKAAFGPVLVIGAITAVVLYSASAGTMERIVATDGNGEGRFLVYPQVWALVLDRPLLGHGLGAFEDVFRAAVPVGAATGAWDKAHNSYLENALELGLPAAAALYLALALIGLQLLRGLLSRRRDRAPVAVAFSCFLLAGFHAFFDFSLQMPALAACFAWLIGIGYVQSFSSTDLGDAPS